NYSHSLNGGDALITSGSIPTVAPVVLPGVQIPTGYDAIIQIVTASGCIVITRVYSSSCTPLPVNFKSFTAARSNANVMLRWETASEQNNTGFFVERNVNGSWEQIAFVPTQAQNGNSDQTLVYSYVDPNNIKGISQYRIRQVDMDGKSKQSEIRSVRANGQLGKTIVYPNPTNNGKVNVVFEDASITREVSVSDLSGRIVRQVKGITNNNITIENLQPGMYMIRIVAVGTGEQVVEKIVVNKQ
ncbi:MAG TPA: T9SS type A sorting domain-containing protein, partial [Chitinophagaceae bacterium]|nr:T9SS type A sorting domain-containing protein [Chitinophagaceae bacterium]